VNEPLSYFHSVIDADGLRLCQVAFDVGASLMSVRAAGDRPAVALRAHSPAEVEPPRLRTG